jgi:hypothetical protein
VIGVWGDLSPVPFPEGKGCLLVGMSPRGLVSVLDGDGLAPSPSGEGWGEVALCFELESQHAYQEHCY